jgi:hypothetical protein
MAEARESSVLFSLQKLMSLEEDRVREEDAARARRLAAEEAARLEALRRARAEEEARIAAEDARRRADEARRREEAVRLEAIARAEIEARRLEAERRAALESAERERRHEEELARLRADAGKRHLVGLVAVCVAAIGALVGGGSWLYFGKIVPERQASEAAHQAFLADQEAEAAKVRQRLEEMAARERDLREKMAAASAAIPPPAPTSAPSAKPGVGPGRPPPPKAKPAGDCPCAHTGDPMCNCL